MFVNCNNKGLHLQLLRNKNDKNECANSTSGKTMDFFNLVFINLTTSNRYLLVKNS